MAVGVSSRVVARSVAASRASGAVIELAERRAPTAPPTQSRLSLRKRCFDVIFASVLLLSLGPALAVIWLTVRLSSPGPGLFWSERVGLANRRFMMPKFRTMRIDAPLLAREQFAGADACITPIGRVLRRFSLDELPQLLSILRGDMSFVGPRPLIQSDPAQAARSHFPEVLGVRPGLSGLAQVRGRNLVTPRRKARLDAFYARTRSWRLDFAIIFGTIGVLLTGRGFM